MYRCATSWGDPGIVSRRKYARGKALRVAKPAFPPRAPPFWPPMKSCLVYIVNVMLIMLKIFEFFDQGAANFLAGHFQDV